MIHICLDPGEEAIEAINYGGTVELCTVVSGLKGKIQFESISCREVEHIKTVFATVTLNTAQHRMKTSPQQLYWQRRWAPAIVIDAHVVLQHRDLLLC